MPFTFEKLHVYQKAVTFADEACTLTRTFPRGYFFLADQLNRAALSIAANIAEGNGRFTKADRRNFFGIARGSVQECVPLLELAARRKLLSDEIFQKVDYKNPQVLRSFVTDRGKMIPRRITGALERSWVPPACSWHCRSSSPRHCPATSADSNKAGPSPGAR